MNARVLLAVALAALLAGCGGLGGAGAAGDESASGPAAAGTVTPVPVESVRGPDVPTPVPVDRLPPGVSPAGEVDPGRLYGAHAATLGESYTFAFERVERRVDGGTERTARVVRRDGNRTLVADDGAWFTGNRSWYVTGDGGYRKAGRTATEYAAVEPRAGESRFLSTRVVVWRYLSTRSAELDVVQRGGREYVRLFVPPGAPPGQVPGVREFAVTAYVTPEGRIASVDVGYVVRRTEVSLSFDVRAVGETTVEPPDWLPAARAAVEAGAASNGTGATERDGSSAAYTGRLPA